MDLEQEGKRVVFDNQGWDTGIVARKKRLPKMVEFVIQNSGGKITSEREANMVLVLLALLVFVVSILVIMRSLKNPADTSSLINFLT